MPPYFVFNRGCDSVPHPLPFTVLIFIDFSASYPNWCSSFLPTERTFLYSLFRSSFISFSVAPHSDSWTLFLRALINYFCTNKVLPVHATKPWMRRRGIAPLILNLGTWCWWVVSFTLRPLYICEGAWYSLTTWLDGHRSGSGHFEEEKTRLPLPDLEPRTVQPVAGRYTD